MTREQWDAEMDELEDMLVDLQAYADAVDAEREAVLDSYARRRHHYLTRRTAQ